MESDLTCCLCDFVARSDNDMETHIDVSHSDIFCLDRNITNDNYVTNVNEGNYNNSNRDIETEDNIDQNFLINNEINSIELNNSESFHELGGQQNLFDFQDNYSNNQPEENADHLSEKVPNIQNDDSVPISGLVPNIQNDTSVPISGLVPNVQNDESVPISGLVPNNPIRKKRGRPSLKSQIEIIKEPTKRGRKSKVFQGQEDKQRTLSRSVRKSEVAPKERVGDHKEQQEQDVLEHGQQQGDVVHEQQEHVQQKHQEVVHHQKVKRSGRKSKVAQREQQEGAVQSKAQPPGRKCKVVEQEQEQHQEEAGEPQQQQDVVQHEHLLLREDSVLHQKNQRSGRKSKIVEHQQDVDQSQRLKRSRRTSQVRLRPVNPETLTETNGIEPTITGSGRKRRSLSLVSEKPKSKKAKVFQSDQYKDVEQQDKLEKENEEIFKLRQELKESELRNSDLELKLMESIQNSAKLESENRALAFNEKAFITAKETITTLSSVVKQKTTELARAKMSEGRLQIEVTKKDFEVEKYREHFESLQSRLKKEVDNLQQDYLACKANSDRFVNIKSSMEKVFDRDERLCDNFNESESFGQLDDDEISEMIQTFIQDTFEASEKFYKDTKKNLSELKDKNDIIETMKLKLKEQKEEIGNLTDKENSLNKQVEAKTLEINNLKITVEEYKDVEIKSKLELLELKEQLQKVEKGNKKIDQENRKIILDLKKELKELNVDNMEKKKEIKTLRQANYDLIKEATDLENLIRPLEEKNLELTQKEAEMKELAKALEVRNEDLLQISVKVQHLAKVLEEKIKEKLTREIDALTEVALINEDLKASEECIDQLTNEIKTLKEEIRTLKSENANQEKKDPDTITIVLKMKAELKDKEKLIKTLQKNNDEINADLEKVVKAKSTLEDSVLQLQDLVKKQESQYLETLQKHDDSLNAVKKEVKTILREKEVEMTKRLQAKHELLDDANKELERKSRQIEKLKIKISDLVEKVEVAEQERESVQQHLVEEEELLELTKRDLDSKLQKAEIKISELVSKVKLVEKEKEKLHQELLNLEEESKMSETSEKGTFYQKFLAKKETLLELTKNEVLRKCEEIKKLEKESSEAKEAFEKEMQKSRDDLSWAQNYCFKMTQRIKDLEKELSNNKQDQPKSEAMLTKRKTKSLTQTSEAKTTQPRKIVKLKIRKH